MSRQNLPNFETPQAPESVSHPSSQLASLSASFYDLRNVDKSPQATASMPSELSQTASDSNVATQYMNIPVMEYPTNDSRKEIGVASSTLILDRAVSIKDLTEKGIFEKIEPSEIRQVQRPLTRCVLPMAYTMADQQTNSAQPNPLLNGQLNYYNFNAADRDSFNTEASLQNCFKPIDFFENRERLAPGSTPTIRIEYEDTGRVSKGNAALPDFRVTADGKVQILNNPELNPFKEIVIEVERASGYVGLPSDAQQDALISLTTYLSERIRQSDASESNTQIDLKDQQGLLPEETLKTIDTAPQPEDSLPVPAQEQTQALNRFDGSGSGSMSPADANDYFPPSEVAPLPDESPNLSALKDLVAGFSTRGFAEPYTTVQDFGPRGYGVGRYSLTAQTIFDWIAGLSDEELAEIEELEITTADGTKKKIKIPKDTGAKLKRIRDLLKVVRAGNSAQSGDPASSQETADESEKALDQLFNDPQIRDFSRLLSQMQQGTNPPGAEQINQNLGPELQELIASDLIMKFARESADPNTNKVNIGQVVLSMNLGKTPTSDELNAPQNKALMAAAERGYPLALQHTTNPDEPVNWSEKNGKVLSNPNQYFFSQFRNETYNPTGPARSNNCGPASLAMAAKAFDKDGDISNIEQQIDRARMAMTWRTNDKELTSLTQIAGGAKKLGLNTGSVSDLKTLNSALESDKQVVLFGNPAGAYGNRLSSGQYAHYNGLHFILVAEKAKDSAGKTSYIVNDPLSRKGSITVSETELNRYMRRDNAGRTGIAVWA